VSDRFSSPIVTTSRGTIARSCGRFLSSSVATDGVRVALSGEHRFGPGGLWPASMVTRDLNRDDVYPVVGRAVTPSCIPWSR
jgi:hypothetical protein